jgi:hypothetical protein
VHARRLESGGLEPREQRLEALHLALRVRQVAAVGVGEVRVEAREPQARQLAHVGEELLGFLQRHAGAAHARVHLDVEPHRALGLDRLVRQRAREAQVADGGIDVVLDRLGDLAGEHRRHRHDRQPAARAAQLHALEQRGHAELRHPLALGGRGHVGGAVAVGVRLRDQQHLAGRTDVLANRPEVRGEAVEVHFDPCRNGHRHGWFSGLGVDCARILERAPRGNSIRGTVAHPTTHERADGPVEAAMHPTLRAARPAAGGPA